MDELFSLFDDYVNESDEEYLTHENMCELASDLGVSIFFMDKNMVGFYLTSKELSENGPEMCLVRHVFIKIGYRKTNVIKLVEADIIETAKGMGVMSVFYNTTRNAEAFIGLLKEDWRIHSQLLKLSI